MTARRPRKPDNLNVIRFRQAEESEEAATPAAAASFAHARLDALARSAPARAGWACLKGCAACCHLLVRVKPPEAARIAEHLRRTRASSELRALARRLRVLSKRVAGLTPGAYRRARVRCAFLGEGDLCSIHEVRPVKCRAHVSRSAEACRAVSSPVPFDPWMAKVGEALHAGLSDQRTEELHHGILMHLTRP